MDGINKDWIGKKVFLVLKTGRNYTGTIREVTESFIFILAYRERKVIKKNHVFNNDYFIVNLIEFTKLKGGFKSNRCRFQIEIEV